MEKRFILGHGECLVSNLVAPKLSPNKNHPYKNRDEVYARLLPEYFAMKESINSLDERFCPDNESVFCVDLHPAYLSKSYFPQRLFRILDLRPIGSRLIAVKPQISTKSVPPEFEHSLEIFVATKRNNFDKIEQSLLKPDLFDDVRKIEKIHAFSQYERLRGDWREANVFEVVLHARVIRDDRIISSMIDLAKQNDIEVLQEQRLFASGLCFLPMRGEKGAVQNLDSFSFLRVARAMPHLRDLVPMLRTSDYSEHIDFDPPEPDENSDCKVAVFDGGCMVPHKLEKWVHAYAWKETMPNFDAIKHGSMVNSAFLFGSYNKDNPCPPVSQVDNYRVLNNEEENGLELYNAISRISQVLKGKEYHFVNLSIGPDLSIDDDEVHAWTAILDEYLSTGNTLLTVAAGNNGEKDRESGNARIQVPSDSVNAMAIGASSDIAENNNWDKTFYSSWGPGRSPGKIKPDLLAFGGSLNNPFIVLSPGSDNQIISSMGTSFSAPYALHIAVSLKKRFPELTPLALKCLLIHKANRKKNYSELLNKHGWGCLYKSIDKYVLCPEGEVTVLFQGKLEAGKYIKAPIPIPAVKMNGNIVLLATLCYATPVDPKDPANYTRSGLEVRFRPKISSIKGNDPNRPDTKPFFDSDSYASESDLRRDSLKWDTVLHGEKTMRASSLTEPFFEIHYMARRGGSVASEANEIPYALLVTLKATHEPNIYEQVAERYAVLNPIEEVIPVTVQIGVNS